MPTPLTITTCSFCSASGFEAQCARGQVRQIHCAAVLGRSLAEPGNVMMESTCETYAVPCCALSANSDVFGCSSLTVLTVLFFLRIFWGAPCLETIPIFPIQSVPLMVRYIPWYPMDMDKSYIIPTKQVHFGVVIPILPFFLLSSNLSQLSKITMFSR